MRGEIKIRIDVRFYRLNDKLPGGKGFPAKYPIYHLIQLSKQIIQPHEFIREYSESHEGSIAFLRAANVEDGYLNTKDFLYVESKKVSKFTDSFIKKGDILITRTGAKAGATVSVRELTQEFCVSSHSIRVVPNKELVNSLYLESFLLSCWGKQQIERLFTGAAQKQLQPKTVGELSIALPRYKYNNGLLMK